MSLLGFLPGGVNLLAWMRGLSYSGQPGKDRVGIHFHSCASKSLSVFLLLVFLSLLLGNAALASSSLPVGVGRCGFDGFDYIEIKNNFDGGVFYGDGIFGDLNLFETDLKFDWGALWLEEIQVGTLSLGWPDRIHCAWPWDGGSAMLGCAATPTSIPGDLLSHLGLFWAGFLEAGIGGDAAGFVGMSPVGYDGLLVVGDLQDSRSDWLGCTDQF